MKQLPDTTARLALARRPDPFDGINEHSLLAAVKMYLALCEEIAAG